MDDRNKSALTCDVTKAVGLWLDARGFKPVETEVPLFCASDATALSWVADLAGVICPTPTELIELKLIRRKPQWSRSDPANQDKRDAWYADCRRLERRLTCLVEVKTTRADFSGDRKWLLPPPTDLAYLAVPIGLIQPGEWPDGWGVLHYAENGMRQVRPPAPQVVTVEQQLDAVLSIAIRRDHRTRYAVHREWLQKRRVEDAEERTERRFHQIAMACLSIANAEHESFEIALGRHRLEKLPDYVKEKLQQLWGCASAQLQETTER